jgi:pyrroloquinoline quinone (PQQ) biosynthesis protein C
MELPSPCGPVSRRMAALIRFGEADPLPRALLEGPLVADRDVQLALWMSYELFYRGFDEVDDGREWDVEVLRLRTTLEGRLEEELRRATERRLGQVSDHDPVAASLLGLVADDEGPHLSAYLRRDATAEQMREFLRERSVQQLKESDPQSFVLPRLMGAAKVALAEIQYDEYGAGRVENLHQDLYARTLEAVGLDATYGAYVTEVSAISLASANVMSLFGLNRRLRGAAIGHFAAFEASSAVPSRRIAAGLERLGMPPAAAAYFLEHVEADSVHEQIAARELCGSFVSDHPSLRADVMFGAACALYLDALSGTELLNRWTPDRFLEDRAS